MIKKMKKILILPVLLFVLTLHGQEPVKWNFSVKKIADKTYELHLTATVENSWNIYSQLTPEGGPLPTNFFFTKNPMLDMIGEVKERGTRKKKYEKVFEVDVLYYKDEVDFVQTVKLKNNIKTTISGTLEYMACNNEQCLPPKAIPFSIPIQ